MKKKFIKNAGRRKFLTSIGALGITGMLPVPVFAINGITRSFNDEILKVGPYLQAAFEDEITVRWVTHQNCYSWVEYGRASGDFSNKVHSVKDGLVEANNRIHAITLTDLEPGTKYYYRICSSTIEEFHSNKIVYGDTYTSPEYYFTSVDPESENIKFSVYNDVQGEPQSFEYLLQFQGDPDKDFYVFNGDMYRFLTDEDQMIAGMFAPVSSLFAARIPFILNRGNHELRGKYSRQFMNFFDGKDGRFYYSFQRGPAYFIFLDSGEDKVDDAIVYGGLVDFDNYRLEQASWLEKEIQKREFKRAKYKIVFSHIPLYYSGDWHGTTHVRKLWGPLLNKGKIDLLLSGHTHKYGMHPPVEGQHNYPIVIGGGLKDGTRTIINVEINEKNLNLQMLNDSGDIVGTLEL